MIKFCSSLTVYTKQSHEYFESLRSNMNNLTAIVQNERDTLQYKRELAMKIMAGVSEIIYGVVGQHFTNFHCARRCKLTSRSQSSAWSLDRSHQRVPNKGT